MAHQRSAGTENSEKLELGDFVSVPALNTSEALILIDAMVANRKRTGAPMNETSTLHQIREYLNLTARFKDREVLQRISDILENHPAGFEYFERAQLATLCPQDADEAKTLIPSLVSKIDDEDLDVLLKQISKQLDMAAA